MELLEKLAILTDAAKYDVACTSSGSDRRGQPGKLGNAVAAGICHSFAADGRCISLLKVLLSNDCAYDCAYCVNRRSNDGRRCTFTPEELCRLTVEFYRRNYIEGLFLSSAVVKNPDYTCELMLKTLKKLREEEGFWGYVHVKAIPGADPRLTQQLGFYADRMSVNIELPSQQSLKLLAPQKSREKILAPMSQIRDGIAERSGLAPLRPDLQSADGTWAGDEETSRGESGYNPSQRADSSAGGSCGESGYNPSQRADSSAKKRFVPAGQSTQMIVGASPESDRQILRLTEGLYQKFSLKRVFFSAYMPMLSDRNLPAVGTPPPLLREHRLYQADWLLRFYGFRAAEILDDEHPNFDPLLDPKCNWAIRHMELFPVEVNRAPYEMLLRVPGIGIKSARRIRAARRVSTLDFDALKKLGVVLKRARFFIVCNGKSASPLPTDNPAVIAGAISERLFTPQQLEAPEQLSLFAPVREDRVKSLSGEL